jgi:O-antigen ligase
MVIRLQQLARDNFAMLPPTLTKWSFRLMVVGGTIALGGILGYLLLTPTGPIVTSSIAASLYLILLAINPINAFLLWLVTQPFSELYLNIPLPAGIPDLTPARFTALFLITVLLAQMATGQRVRPSFTKIDLLAILTIIGLAMSIPTAVRINSAAQYILDNFAIPLIIYFIAKNLVTSEQEIHRVLKAVLVIGVYAAIYIIYENTTGNVLFVDPTKAFSVQYSENVRKVQGLFGSPNAFGLIFAFSIPLCFYFLLRSKSISSTFFYSLLVALLFVGVFLTFKRTPWIGTLAALFIIQFFFPRFRRVFIILLLISSVTMLMFWDEINDTAVVQERVNNRVDTANGRTYRWQAAFDLWQEKPLLGQGFGQFNRLSRHHAVESRYLQFLVSAGLVGFVPYVLLLGFILAGSITVYRRARDNLNFSTIVSPELVVIFWGCFAAYINEGITDEVSKPIVNILFFLLVGTILGSSQGWMRRTNHQTQYLPDGPN